MQREARQGRPELSRLRDPLEQDSEAPLFVATLRLRIPPDLWTGGFSERHRALRLEALNRTDLTEDTSISDYWISGHPPGAWAAEIESYADVVRVESLAEVADGCLYRVTYRNPPVVYAYRRLKLPIQFPLRIQGGFITWEVVGRRAEFDEVLRFARSRTKEVSVVSIRRRPLRSHLPLLTESQHRLLAQAMAAGYFAVPRGITLTELARALGRSKSSTSEAIALIEKKLLESALQPTTAPG
ncbi:MAG TPA: helix-turn-helix domain-containing protein [Thermoplasmata archaeon]|nr:helix-turn-helix domain-containing protein [Thermoplasmata archaeon]